MFPETDGPSDSSFHILLNVSFQYVDNYCTVLKGKQIIELGEC